MIAHVVPVTRLRRATSWWSYRIPSRLHCSVGSLVTISFRGRPCLGVVWEIQAEDSDAREEIISCITKTPLVRAPQRALIEWLADYGLCSLSTALYTWLPRGLRLAPLSRGIDALCATWDVQQPTALELAQVKQHVVLTPGSRPESIAQLQQKFGDRFRELAGGPSILAECQAWLDVGLGKIQIGVGRERALFAPWVNLRHCTIIEPEDISYYHEQVPYLNLIEAAKVLAEASRSEVVLRSNLPLEAAQDIWGKNSVGTLTQATCSITDLRKEPILNTTLIAKVKEVLAQGKEVILLYNALDRLHENSEGERVVIPGIQTTRKRLAALLDVEELPPTIHLGTRTILSQPHRNIGLTAILSLDPLLNQQNTGDQLHGWGDLGRLLQIPAPCIIQTHAASHPLVQTLRNNQFAAYTVSILEENRQAELPPFVEQVVCSLDTTRESSVKPMQVHEQLQTLALDGWQLSHPYPALRRKKPMLNILLTAPTGTRLPSHAREYLAALPSPWKIQRNPWYAL